MVDVPRKGAFEADVALMWQGRARKAEAKLDKVRPYLHHHFHCVWHEANCADKCDCGFQQALQEQGDG